MKEEMLFTLKTLCLIVFLLVGYAGYVLLTMGDCYLKDGNYSAAKKISADVYYAFTNMMTQGELNHVNRVDEQTVYATTPFQQCRGDVSFFDKGVENMEKH